MVRPTKYGLRPKVYRFVLEYLIDLNGKQAAIRAGYSPKTAENQASTLLSNAKVQRAVALENQRRITKLQINAEKVLQEIARLAFSDVRKMVDANGNIVDLKTLDDDAAASIASVEVNELFAGRGDEREIIGQVKKLKFWDKTAALTLLGRHLKLFVDKLEVDETSKVEILDRTRAANERVNRLRRQAQGQQRDATE